MSAADIGPDEVMPDPGVPAVTVDSAELDGLRERTPAEHVAVYERIHGELRSALADIDGA